LVREGKTNLGTVTFVPRFFLPSLASAKPADQYHLPARAHSAFALKRCGLEYTLQCFSRKKPTSVRPEATARFTARLDGAPMAARIPTPVRRAFWVSSKLARPLNKMMCSLSGRRPA